MTIFNRDYAPSPRWASALILLSTTLLMAISPGPKGTAIAADGRLEAVKSANKLQICIWPAYYGITFRNPRDSQLRGIDIDLAKTLSNDLGVAPVFVDSSFASFMDDLDADKCDIAMFGIGHTEARRARVDLTEPHLRSGMYGITTKTNSSIRNWADIDQPGRVVAVQKGTVMEPYMLQNAKKAEVRVIVPPDTREDEVLSGRADVFMTDYPYSLRMQFQHDWARVIAPPQIVNPVDYGFAIKKGQPDWLARVNSFIAQVKKDGRLMTAAKANQMEQIALTK
ncbi:ABC transporter substrate-binding protein [Elstera sp.]|jgi:ABC-type amino acid transport substrate-binding protein|uniref:ABC transporter substrate-binding protein n=1 Tax=Elstera sp. TaxID=1916664 RepID=UPI0037BFC849